MAFKSRKNFLPTLILAFSFWALWGTIVFTQPPTNNFLIAFFFLFLFIALFLTTALIFANSRRGFLFSLFLILFLIFRYYQMSSILNILLLTAILIALELYLK